MTGLYLTVPVACFRKGMAREYLETEELPPPATCYGFLLSLVGESNRRRHQGCRVTAGLVGGTARSVVLRTVWRVKKSPLGSAGNTRPDYQQLLTGDSAFTPFVELVLWLDSSQESADTTPGLESRIAVALDPAQRGRLSRFGGLSLGESTHLVDSVWTVDEVRARQFDCRPCRVFLLSDQGRMTLPVWVDHVGSAGTRHVVGDLVDHDLSPPPVGRVPQILPL